jgi:hypothetical protein
MDWRRIQPEGMTIEASFPCRPASHARTVSLNGAPVTMTLHACTADGLTFGLAAAELPDVRRVDVALVELADSAARNIAATVDGNSAADVPGMTPNVAARRLRLAGRLPDGRAVIEHASFFAHGTRVYQATLLGGDPARPVVDQFFAGLKIRQ